jgi:nitroreductase
MLNDRSSALSLLKTRRSGKPREMVAPGPSPAELQQILAIGSRTPDHGTLTPWRFVTVADDQRDQLAALLGEALAEEEPDAPPAKFTKAEEFAHSGAALVVVISAPVPDHKIPVWEQILSCGAAAMNILHAAHALGFAGGWVTGRHADSDRVSAAFCESGERIAGFIFIGTPGRELEERPRPELSAVWRPWRAPEI